MSFLRSAQIPIASTEKRITIDYCIFHLGNLNLVLFNLGRKSILVIKYRFKEGKNLEWGERKQNSFEDVNGTWNGSLRSRISSWTSCQR